METRSEVWNHCHCPGTPGRLSLEGMGATNRPLRRQTILCKEAIWKGYPGCTTCGFTAETQACMYGATQACAHNLNLGGNGAFLRSLLNCASRLGCIPCHASTFPFAFPIQHPLPNMDVMNRQARKRKRCHLCVPLSMHSPPSASRKQPGLLTSTLKKWH